MIKEVTSILSILFTCGFEHAMFAQSFTNIAIETGMNDSADSYGATWGDYDNDGDLDLFNSTYGGPNRLYRNEGDEIFQEVALFSGVDGNSHRSLGVSWADIDNDGDLDLFVGVDDSRDKLFQNNEGFFTEIGESSGFKYINATYSGVWADYDNDRDLDLFTADFREIIQLYQNNQGYFSDLYLSTHIVEEGTSRSGVWGDYDNDGDLDLYVCRGYSQKNLPDLLYRNDNDYFTEVASSVGISEVLYSVGADWGDYDNDGDLDLYVTTKESQPNKLYQNDDGIFTDVSAEKGIDDSEGSSYSPAWVDYDNDGDLDLFVSKIEDYSNVMFMNENGTFTEVQNEIGLGYDTGRSIGISWGDFNGDGFLDVYVPNRYGQNYFYRNSDNSNHWLIVTPIGIASNRNGIGARVTVFSGDLSQIREVKGGSGTSSQNSIPVEFGLGEKTAVDSVVIRWPSGIIQVQNDIEVDQYLTVTEYGPQNIVVNPSDTLDFGTGLLNFQLVKKLIIRNAGTETLEIYNMEIDSPNFTVLNPPNGTLLLGAGERFEAEIGFIPLEEREYSAVLTISSNDSDNLENPVLLIGRTSSLLPIAFVVPETLSIELFPWESLIHVLLIKNDQNVGGTDLNFSASMGYIQYEGINIRTESITVYPNSGTIASQEYGLLYVRFNAPELNSGLYTGSIVIKTNDPIGDIITIPFRLKVKDIWTRTEDKGMLPETFMLYQNFPNPFNPSTTISYQIPERSHVELTLYDILGRRITTLVNRIEEPGFKSILWDAKDKDGIQVNSGLYFTQMKTEDFIQTRKMIYLK